MAVFSDHAVSHVIGSLFPFLPKPQKTVFSLFITGICKARSGIMTEAARKIPGAICLRSRAKRFWRFVANKRFHPSELFLFWVRWVIVTFVQTQTIHIAIDWTELPGKIRVLMAAIPFKGRAIPLYWILIRNSSLKDSQNLIEMRFIKGLCSLLPPTLRISWCLTGGLAGRNLFSS